MTSLTWVVAIVLAGWLAYNLRCLLLNYRKALKLGLPIVIGPVSPENPLWMAVQNLLAGVLKNLTLPAAISNLQYCKTGWEFSDRYHSHEKFGDAWVLVTPAWVWLYVADADAIADIFARGKEFKRPLFMVEALNVFGPSVGTTEGQAWQRQRKLTAPSLNETKMSTVWDESVNQADGMLKSWTTREQGFSTTEDDTRTLALHVLAYAAFKKSYPYSSLTQSAHVEMAGKRDTSPMTYRDSIAIILQNAILILALPHAVLSWPIMPAGIRRIGEALSFFRKYMITQIANERDLLERKGLSSGSVVSSYVRAADETMGQPLSESEILGNIFLLNFAGHDTTALTLSYGIALLAVYPEVQDWINEEISHVGPSVDYETAFPKLKRTLAVLLETVRLYNPIPGVPKFVDEHTTARLTVQNKTFLLEPKTLVVPNMQASHTHPRHWGPDSLLWRPQRWISATEGMGTESIFVPPKGTYFPFSDGMRSCLGKKFAQVEWVATLMTLFRDYRVEPVVMPGESMDGARQRTLDVVKDSNLKLLMSMRNPHRIVLRWKTRG